jgi:hypothetical protein
MYLTEAVGPARQDVHPHNRERLESLMAELDALEMIRAQIAAYEEAESLTPEQQESYETAKNVLATVEELTRQGHKINLKLE